MQHNRLLLINRICDQFESRLQGDQKADIHQFLESVDSDASQENLEADLIPELVVLQILYSDDRHAAAEALQVKYPQCGAAIESALAQPSRFGTVQEFNGDTKVSRSKKPHSIPAETLQSMGDRFGDLKYLASGGLGDVYTGYDSSVHRRVAIKLMKAELVSNAEAKRRFLNEGSITGGLEHPGIVPVYDSGISESGRPFYVMRLFGGRTMKEDIEKLHADAQAPDFLERRRNLIRRLADISDAISFAHDHQVIHRDLKPANIMLGDYGESIVIDWGLAKKGLDAFSEEAPEKLEPTDVVAEDLQLAQQELTRAGAILGTPGYMSPEQACGDSSQVGVAADVYSLGAVLFNVITGTLPPAKGSPPFSKHGKRQSDLIGERNSGALQNICSLAMHQNPVQRYSDVRSFGADLRNWLNDMPVVASPDSTLDRAARFLRKNRNWSVIAAMTLVAIATGSLIAASAFSSKSARLALLQKEAVAATLIQKDLADENLEMANQERESGLKLRARQGVLESYIRLSVQESGDFSKETLKELILERIERFKESNSIAPAIMLEHVDFAIYALSLITDHDEALRMHREFSALRKSVNGDNRTQQIQSAVKEADLCLSAKRAKEARKLIEEFRPQAISELGTDHELTRQLLRFHVLCLRGKKDLVTTRETIQLIYPWLQQWEQDGLPDTINVEELYYCEIFARDLCFEGKVEQGSVLWKQLYELAADSLGATEVHTLESLMYYAKAMERFGTVELALPPHRQLAELYEQEFGALATRTIFIEMQTVRLLLENQSGSEALELVQTIREKATAENLKLKKDLAHLDVLYARALLLVGEREQAVDFLDAMFEKTIVGLGPRGTDRFRKSWELAKESGEMSEVVKEIQTAIERARIRWDPYSNLTVSY